MKICLKKNLLIRTSHPASRMMNSQANTQYQGLLLSTRDYYSVPEIIQISVIFWIRLVEPDRVSDIFGCFPNLDRYDTEHLHPWGRVDQACSPLPLNHFSILVGLTFKLLFLCSRYW